MRASLLLPAILLLGLAGCGNTPLQRAGSGGLIGAGAGAGIAAIAGGPVLGAALLGGLGGAAIGAVTTPTASYGRSRRRAADPARAAS